MRRATVDPGAQVKAANDERFLFIVGRFYLCSRDQLRWSIAQKQKGAVNKMTASIPVTSVWMNHTSGTVLVHRYRLE